MLFFSPILSKIDPPRSRNMRLPKYDADTITPICASVNENEDKKPTTEDIKKGEEETDSQFNKLNERAKLRNLLSVICKLDISKLKNPLSIESCESKLNDILSAGDTDIDMKINSLIKLSEFINVLLKSEAAQLSI